MNSTLSKNPYEYLKLDELCEIEPIPALSSWSITDDQAETVSILTSVLDNGLWCYGYSVFWKNGRHSHCNPDPAKGLFHSQREAQLYALGFRAGSTISVNHQAVTRRADSFAQRGSNGVPL